MKSHSVADEWQQAPRLMKGHAHQQGMTLMEWLLSLMIGLMLTLGALQTLVSQQQLTARLAKLSKTKAELRSALNLIRAEAFMADRIEWRSGMWQQSTCPLSGRRIVLQLIYSTGNITYSMGQPPSAIWRKQALMRCGPAYGSDGVLGTGLHQNRVLLDGVKDISLQVASDRSSPITLELTSFLGKLSSAQESIRSTANLPMRR